MINLEVGLASGLPFFMVTGLCSVAKVREESLAELIRSMIHLIICDISNRETTRDRSFVAVNYINFSML